MQWVNNMFPFMRWLKKCMGISGNGEIVDWIMYYDWIIFFFLSFALQIIKKLDFYCIIIHLHARASQLYTICKKYGKHLFLKYKSTKSHNLNFQNKQSFVYI